MAQLQQRVFMIFVRPCFVKKSPAVGYPNTITKYFGKIYRDALAGETQYELLGAIPTANIKVDGVTPASAVTLKTGYKLTIQLPELNASIPTSATDATGGGIERYYPDTKGRMPSSVTPYSTPPFNENNWFANDPWMLHSTWTSFEETKIYVRFLIDLLGFDGVLVGGFVPLDLELLPNK